MDDLVDGDDTPDHDAQYWITQCSQGLDARLNSPKEQHDTKKPANVASPKHQALQAALDQLPLSKLSRQPLFDLLRGFEMDLDFDAHRGHFPIHTEADLDMYAYRVASTVAMLVLDLGYHDYTQHTDYDNQRHREKVIRAGIEMGKALQCVNIARDIGRDAAISRVYIPTSWLAGVGLTPEDVIRRPQSKEVHVMQGKMLDRADMFYLNSRAAIEELPACVRGPMRVTVESYMEIGRALRATKTIRADGGKFRLSLWRRLTVAWAAMGGCSRSIS